MTWIAVVDDLVASVSWGNTSSPYGLEASLQ
jgi:hypothetical protein